MSDELSKAFDDLTVTAKELSDALSTACAHTDHSECSVCAARERLAQAIAETE